MASPILKENRNILVVGKTGAGKSTVANAILGISGEKYFPVSGGPSSTVSETACGQCEFDAGPNKRYCITVIDTIGLFDTKRISNKEIMDTTKKRIKKYVDGLHLIIFVMKLGRLTEEEKMTFQLVHERFAKDIDPISALVITGCELEEDKDDVVRQYQDDLITKEIVGHMKKGIYAVGFPELDHCQRKLKEIHEANAKDDVKKLYEKIIYPSNTMFLKKELYDNSWWCTIL